MLTAEFTQAVDALIQDASLSDDALHTRAHQSLETLADSSQSSPTHLPVNGPPWARRIQEAIPQYPTFSTLHLLRALYFIADELGLVAGKRYVSASICVCADRAALLNSEGQSTDSEANLHLHLVEALDDLASTWVAFVLWPFYAHGVDDTLNPPRDRHWKFWQDPTIREADSGSEGMTPGQLAARVQQRRWKAEVMARDGYRCFMSGYPNTDWFFREHPALAQGDEGDDDDDEDLEFNDCDIVPIIKREALLELPDTNQEIMHSILERFFGVDAQTILEKAEGPQNTLFVNISACVGFREFRWCLRPTEFDCLLRRPHWLPRYSGSTLRWPAPSGGAFWASVVEYGGAETCLEVELGLRLSVEAL